MGINQLPAWISVAFWLCLQYFAKGTAMNGAVPDEQRLYRDLMWGYESSVRPVVNATQTIHITFSISINQIVDLDERKQVLTTNVFIDQEWVDENLKWNVTEYNGIRTLRVPATQVWLPDTFVFNNADDGSTGFMHGVYVLLNANGTVLWPVPVKLKSSCKVDIAYFPFDDQLCILRFGSWIYSGEWITFSSSLKALDLGNYMDNSEWELITVFFEQTDRTYSCCPESHPDLSFILHMRRRTFYYIFNIIVPCIMLSVLTLLTFWIPMTSGEKVSLGLSVFLAFSMFMLLIAEEVPATSESVPLIGIYLTTVMTMTSVSVIMAVMVINLYERGSKARRPPHWVKVVVLRWICTILRMKHDIERLAHSIRLDEEEEKRYYCPTHSGLDKPRSRRSSYLSPRGIMKACSNQVSPDTTRMSPTESETGELSKRFSLIEQESTRRRTGGMVNTGMSSPGAAVTSDDDAGEDEPIWQRRDEVEHSRNQLHPPRQQFNQSAQFNQSTQYLEPPRQHSRVHTPNAASHNGAGHRSDGLFGMKYTRIGPQPSDDTNNQKKPEFHAEQHQRGSQNQRSSRQESHYKQKQDSLADLVVQVCRREKALLNRKEIVVEWQTIATVIDRLLFWVFLTATVVCYIIILFVIPTYKPVLKVDTDQMRILKRT